MRRALLQTLLGRQVDWPVNPVVGISEIQVGEKGELICLTNTLRIPPYFLHKPNKVGVDKMCR